MLFFLVMSLLLSPVIPCFSSTSDNMTVWHLTLRPQVDWAVPTLPLYQHHILQFRKRKTHNLCPLQNEDGCSFVERMKTISMFYWWAKPVLSFFSQSSYPRKTSLISLSYLIIHFLLLLFCTSSPLPLSPLLGSALFSCFYSLFFPFLPMSLFPPLFSS